MKKTLIGVTASCVLAGSASAQQLEVWAEGLRKPLEMVEHPQRDGLFYVLEQGGVIRVIEDGSVRDGALLVLDKSNFTDRSWEQGLLGMAFGPDFAESGTFYLNYSGNKGQTRVSRFTLRDAYAVEPDSEELVIEIDQPYANHNGGCIRFGPDGMLYIGMGDGGSANDPLNAGQDLSTLLGKLVRIDVSGEPDAGLGYAVPDDNPFVGQDGIRPEIWSYGLRNPWRFEFDSLGRVWIGDVGQNRFEEIHLQAEGSSGGENYGWKVMEGDGTFRPGSRRSQDPKRLRPREHGEQGFSAPVYAYRQDSKLKGSVTGGYFYESDRLPSLRGRYIFAEFMTGEVFSFELDENNRADDIVDHTDATRPAFGDRGPELAPSSFAIDRAGNLYLMDHKGGRVMRFFEPLMGEVESD